MVVRARKLTEGRLWISNPPEVLWVVSFGGLCSRGKWTERLHRSTIVGALPI